MSATTNKPEEAPLTGSDVPEQDGSEDPGAAIEVIHTPVDSANAGTANAQKSDKEPSVAASVPTNPTSKKGI